MRYRVYGYRHADFLFPNLEEYSSLWAEIVDALEAITEEMIIAEFEGGKRQAKSISEAINKLIKHELVSRGWTPESNIFADPEYERVHKGTWRIDFAKDNLSVEVAFNHRSDISWNLIKPTLASELNHVEKAIQTTGGVIITATEAMKAAGGFDNAIGTYEDYVQYLRPMRNLLTVPLMIVGLEAPESFTVEVVQTDVAGKKRGEIVYYIGTANSGVQACPKCGSIIDGPESKCPECDCKIVVR